MRSGVPSKSGKNREAGENPAGRATVKNIADYAAMDQSQETCPDAVQLLNGPRKGVQAAGIFPFREVPSQLSLLRAKR